MRIYLDLVVLLNFAVDFLLLLGTNQLSGFPAEGKRIAGAAALGGIYSGVCLLPGFGFLGNLLWRMVSLGGIALLGFGWNRSALKRCGIFLLLSMALGGLAMGIHRIDFGGLLLAAAGILILCKLAFGDRIGGKNYVWVSITHGQRELSLIALRDSGNTLRDPITGESVLVISADAAYRLTGLLQTQLESPLETLASRPVPGLRLIPYQAVGQSGGMLLGMRMEQVRIGSRAQSMVVAFAPEGFGKGQMVQALTGGMI